MKPIVSIVTLLFLLTSVLYISGQILSSPEDKTLSPYFYIQSDDPETDRLPLKSTSAKVNIAGVIADVTITQKYTNEGKKPIEAIYVFPASTQAAVYSMVMTIGERVIVARIQEREKARQEYEQAKNNGQSASLLEQERPNVFTMNVANIMPGDQVRVELKYTEALVPVDRIYQFVYPTVVGPRYSGSANEIASAGEGWNANPYTTEGIAPLYEVDIKVNLTGGMALKDIKCPSHQTEINYSGLSRASVNLSPLEKFGGNRDFILKYRLAGQKIETGVLLFQGDKENFFLAMVQPPDRVSPEMIPPREYIFIMDVSGSMNGYPIDISKKLLTDLISGLKPTDRFNVILFAGGSEIMAEKSLPAVKENLASAIRFIEKENGGGGTELLPAMKKALSLPGTEGYSRTFIIATDGYVTVEKEVFDLVRRSLGEANFFAFGIGTGVNRYLIEGLAHAGQGEPFVVTKEEEAGKSAAKFRKYISNPVLTDIKISFNDFDAYDLAQESYPDVFSERPVIIFGKYKGIPKGKIVVTGKGGREDVETRIDLASIRPDDANSGLRYLWAREKIMMLDDLANSGYEGQDVEDQVIALGLEYNLLTRHTSFIAIDSEIRNTEGNNITIRQPLPLPQGVSNYAVGRCVGGVSAVMNNKASAESNISYEMVVEDNNAADEKFVIVENPPEFKGGEKGLDDFIKMHLKYPEVSAKNYISGRVIVEFTVDTDGTVKDIRILYSLDNATDQEVVRVVKLMSGMWKPAERDGKPVAARVVISNFVFKP
ncbi:MAG: TonB family protein [Bacteroidales bacterium]|nr:TonB family protein [Bacteroidales bacterium]